MQGAKAVIKKTYSKPHLVRFGSVNELTQILGILGEGGGTGSGR